MRTNSKNPGEPRLSVPGGIYSISGGTIDYNMVMVIPTPSTTDTRERWTVIITGIVNVSSGTGTAT